MSWNFDVVAAMVGLPYIGESTGCIQTYKYPLVVAVIDETSGVAETVAYTLEVRIRYPSRAKVGFYGWEYSSCSQAAVQCIYDKNPFFFFIYTSTFS